MSYYSKRFAITMNVITAVGFLLYARNMSTDFQLDSDLEYRMKLAFRSAVIGILIIAAALSWAKSSELSSLGRFSTAQLYIGHMLLFISILGVPVWYLLEASY